MDDLAPDSVRAAPAPRSVVWQDEAAAGIFCRVVFRQLADSAGLSGMFRLVVLHIQERMPVSRASPASLASQPGAPPEAAGEREPGTGPDEPLVSGAADDDDEDLPAARGAATASASADPVKDYLKQIG